MEKPQTHDESGCNLDPAKCDCGKGAYCPLWNPQWDAYYASRGDVDAHGFKGALREWWAGRYA